MGLFIYYYFFLYNFFYFFLFFIFFELINKLNLNDYIYTDVKSSSEYTMSHTKDCRLE